MVKNLNATVKFESKLANKNSVFYFIR